MNVPLPKSDKKWAYAGFLAVPVIGVGEVVEKDEDEKEGEDWDGDIPRRAIATVRSATCTTFWEK